MSTKAKAKTVKAWTPTVGATVFCRTITYHYTGEVVAVTDRWLVLTHAAWVADSGRFSGALAAGTLNEVEPYPGDGVVCLALAAIVDVCPWAHPLPRTQK